MATLAAYDPGHGISLGLGALHPALAESNARALICALPCHGATLFGCFSAKCLQPKPALLMVFGLLWLLAYSGLELRRAPRLLTSDSETAIAVVREADLHPRPAGIVALALPTDFTRIGSTACASRQQLKLLICPKLRITAKEAFLNRTSLQEVSTPALHGAMRCCRQYALSSKVQTKKKQHMAKDICP